MIKFINITYFMSFYEIRITIREMASRFIANDIRQMIWYTL